MSEPGHQHGTGTLMLHLAKLHTHSCYREDAELGERAVADRAALPTT